MTFYNDAFVIYIDIDWMIYEKNHLIWAFKTFSNICPIFQSLGVSTTIFFCCGSLILRNSRGLGNTAVGRSLFMWPLNKLATSPGHRSISLHPNLANRNAGLHYYSTNKRTIKAHLYDAEPTCLHLRKKQWTWTVSLSVFPSRDFLHTQC